MKERVTNKQQIQKDYHDSDASRCHFTIGDTTFVCNFPASEKMLPGTVTQNKSPLLFLIKL